MCICENQIRATYTTTLSQKINPIYNPLPISNYDLWRAMCANHLSANQSHDYW